MPYEGARTCTITYKSAHGDIPNDLEIETTGSYLPPYALPVLEEFGFNFIGWSYNGELLTEGAFSFKEGATYLFTAVWEEVYKYEDESSGANKPRLRNNNVDLQKILDKILDLGLVDETIKFTVAGAPLRAKKGMTWGEWIDSEYNKFNEYVVYSSIVYKDAQLADIPSLGCVRYNGDTNRDLLPEDTIVPNGEYFIAFIMP